MENTNKEIENILNEEPLIDVRKTKFENRKSSIKKFKMPKKKTLLIIGGVIVTIIIVMMLIPNQSNCGETIVSLSNAEFVDLVKQQIIENGKVNIGDLTLSPYIG